MNKTQFKKLSAKEMNTVKGGADNSPSNDDEFEYYYDENGVQQKRKKLRNGGHGNVLL